MAKQRSHAVQPSPPIIRAAEEPPRLTVSRAAARRFLLDHQRLFGNPTAPSSAALAASPGSAPSTECAAPEPARSGGSAAPEPALDAIRRLECVQIDPVNTVATQILDHVRRHGPVSARDFSHPDKVVGYWDRAGAPKTKTSSLALEVLWETGQLVISGRNGNLRFYDLPKRVLPPELLARFAAIPAEEAWRALRHKYYRAYRLFEPGDFRFGWRRQPAAERRAALEADLAAGIVVPVVVEGVKRRYYALAEDADELRQAESSEADGAAFLSPLDNLLWRRERLQDLFGFAYNWEQYVPAAKRQFGAYAMPILAGDQLVGRLDPRLDRAAGVLTVNRLALEPGLRPTRALARSINLAMSRLLSFLRAGSARYGEVNPTSLIRLLD